MKAVRVLPEDGNTSFRKNKCSSKKIQTSSTSSNLALDSGDVDPSMHEKLEKSSQHEELTDGVCTVKSE